jgi:2-C-methyl-D-erythritol 4-phosphate cytidylyltransferase/2-C-methyl-D-erythritol 2,4-cyclodiphosphate synthase
MKVAAVIAAGGTGTRMNASIPKQFLYLGDKPIFVHTIDLISSLEAVFQIILTLPEEHIPVATEILSRHRLRVPVQCIAGGINRQESVHHGVLHVDPEAEIIMVHDAVRPACDQNTMLRVLEAARKKGAAIPGLPATETIQRVSRKGRVLATPAREELFAIQTPQAFHREILQSALDKARSAGFIGTDESSVVRWAGHTVYVVPGSPENIKITRPMDLEIAERLISGNLRKEDNMEMSNSTLRIGQGIDFHRLIEGRKLILGGVEIPFERGLDGHSDADVLAHAICDALLGAAALGDIGQHFPDTDPANRNRSSLEFLREARARIEATGWMIQNVDATVLAQKPKLMPHAPAIRKNIAESLGVSIDTVSIKATTTEGMNAEGRGEGISAQAIALLRKK